MGYEDDDGVKTLTDAAAADRAGFGRRGDQVGITLRLPGLGMGFVLIVGGGGGAGRSWTARAEDGAVVRVGVGVGGGRRADAIGLDGSHHDEEGERQLHGCWSLRVCAETSRAGLFEFALCGNDMKRI